MKTQNSTEALLSSTRDRWREKRRTNLHKFYKNRYGKCYVANMLSTQMEMEMKLLS